MQGMSSRSAVRRMCASSSNDSRPSGRVDDQVDVAVDQVVDRRAGAPSCTLLTARTCKPALAADTRAVPPGREQLEAQLGEPARHRQQARLVAIVHREERRALRAAAGAPAPSQRLGEGRRRSLGSHPITSPVDFISGPSTGSTPGKRLNGKTGALTNTAGTAGSSVKPDLLEASSPPSRCDASATSGTPTALAMNGTVREARGLTSSTNTSPSSHRELHVHQARPRPAARARRSAMSRIVVERRRRDAVRRQHRRRVAGVDARLLDVLQDAARPPRACRRQSRSRSTSTASSRKRSSSTGWPADTSAASCM